MCVCTFVHVCACQELMGVDTQSGRKRGGTVTLLASSHTAGCLQLYLFSQCLRFPSLCGRAARTKPTHLLLLFFPFLSPWQP